MQTPEIHHDDLDERSKHHLLVPAFIIAMLAIAFICAFVTLYR